MSMISGQGRTQGPVGNNPILGTVGLVGMGISIWALACAAAVSLRGLSLLLDLGLHGGPAGIIQNVVMSGVAGIFAGVAMAIMRCWPRQATHLTKSFISALFSKGLAEPQLDAVFWGRVAIGGTVGFVVGAVGGASGIISVPQFVSGSASDVLTSSYYPLVAFVGGGFGGPGGTDVWALLFLIIVVIIAAILIGFLSGVLLQIALAGIGGMTKGATKTYTERILEERSNADEQPHPILAGMKRGAFVGLLSGSIQAVFTVWGIIKFYPAK